MKNKNLITQLHIFVSFGKDGRRKKLTGMNEKGGKSKPLDASPASQHLSHLVAENLSFHNHLCHLRPLKEQSPGSRRFPCRIPGVLRSRIPRVRCPAVEPTGPKNKEARESVMEKRERTHHGEGGHSHLGQTLAETRFLSGLYSSHRLD